MDIIISAVIVLIGSLIRKLTEKFGYQTGRAITVILFFVLSAIAGLVYQAVDKSFWQEATKFFMLQMAIYEVVYKTILKPLFSKD